MNEIYLKYLPEQLDDDFAAICNVLTPQNLIETELLLHILKRKANDFFNDVVGYSESILNNTIKKRDYKLSKQELYFLNQIIYRTPTNTEVFMEALLARIIYFERNQKYPLARDDILYLQSFDPKHMTTRVFIIVQTFMCICLYFMREMREARIYLDRLEKLLAELPVRKLVKESHELQAFLGDLDKYKEEIQQSTNNTRIQFVLKRKPATDFKIRRTCTFNGEQIFASKDVAKDQVVVLEEPQFFQFTAPFTNCEVCGVFREHLYTCRDCRYRSYCSMDCIQMDWDVHSYECYGYKIGLIPMLETTILFRCFVAAAQYLSTVFNKFLLKNRPLRDATAVWHFIVEHCSQQKTIIGEFLSRQPNCKLLTIAKWRQLMTNAFRLAVFVHNDTILKATYFSQLELSKDECIKLIAALLMRLSVHITLNSQLDKLQFMSRKINTAIAANPAYEPANLSRINANAFEYYDINAYTDFVDCFSNLQELTKNSIRQNQNSPLQTTPQYDPMSKLMSKLFSLHINTIQINTIGDLFHVKPTTGEIIGEYLQTLSSSNRYKLFATIFNNFHKFIFGYFLICGPRRQEKWSLCCTLKIFKHSCVPNIKLRTLADGRYLGRAAIDLKAGTELTVCFNSVDMFMQNRRERHAVLKESGIICSCKLCSLPAYIEPVNIRNAILCAFCEEDNVITQVPGNCFSCHADYNKQLQELVTFISHIVREIRVKESDPNATQRDLAILHGTYSNYVTMHFSEGHELRLVGILSFVEFLTTNGFLKQASDVIIALHCSYYAYYENSAKFYSKGLDALIFKMVRAIIERYLAALTYSTDINTDQLKQLLAIVLHTLKNQESHLDPSIDDPDTYNTMLDNFALYYKWKKLFSYFILMPKALKSYLNLS